MRRRTGFIAVFLSIAVLALAARGATPSSHRERRGQSGTKRYLYMSMPDAAQKEGRSDPPGILVFDIDNGHKFVRRIEVPVFSEGLRGFAGSLKTHCVYFSSTNRRLGAFDLETEKVVWQKTYDGGCDRSSITIAGKKIYVPTGYWDTGADSRVLVVIPANVESI